MTKNLIERTIRLDIQGGKNPADASNSGAAINQGNSNSVVFRFKVFDGPVETDYGKYTGARLSLAGKGQTSMYFNGPCELNEDGASITLTPEALSHTGAVTGQLDLFDDVQNLATLYFDFKVLPNLGRIDAHARAVYISEAQALLDEIRQGAEFSGESIDVIGDGIELLNKFKYDLGQGVYDGASIDLRPGVYSRETLPAFSETKEGQAFVVLDELRNQYDLYTHIINGSAWNVLEGWGRVAGPTGLTGIQGPKGHKGEKGDKGDTGEKGDKGESGEKGERGPQGIQGEKGDKGDTGQKGDKGDQGERGEQGLGLSIIGSFPVLPDLESAYPDGGGLKGGFMVESFDPARYFYWDVSQKAWKDGGELEGARGPEGPRGIQGEKGEAGPAGLNGERGERGGQGEQGPEGPQGERGEQGEQGPVGPQGEKGEQGPAGPQGEKGLQGPIGLTGAQGIQGIQGETGPRGPQGEKGDPALVDTHENAELPHTLTDSVTGTRYRWGFTLTDGAPSIIMEEA